MKTQPKAEKICNDPLAGLPSAVFNIQEKESHGLRGRSNPLKSTYNSTFITIVVSISAVLALILVFFS